MIPATALPPQRFKDLAEAIPRVDLQYPLDGRNDRQIALRVGLVADTQTDLTSRPHTQLVG